MEYTITAITREQIPNNMFVFKKSNINVTNLYLYLFQFMNGNMLVYGSNEHISNIEEIIDDLKIDIDIWYDIKDNCNNFNDFQLYNFENNDTYIPIEECEKMWNYFVNNNHFIQYIIYYFEGETDSFDETIDDEGIYVD